MNGNEAIWTNMEAYDMKANEGRWSQMRTNEGRGRQMEANKGNEAIWKANGTN